MNDIIIHKPVLENVCAYEQWKCKWNERKVNVFLSATAF